MFVVAFNGLDKLIERLQSSVIYLMAPCLSL